MIRYRAMLIAAGYPDGNDCDALRSDPVFKMAVGRLPESGDDLCSQPSISRLENLPGSVALKRMMAAMVELFCDKLRSRYPDASCSTLTTPRTGFMAVPSSWRRLFNAHYDSRCFLPIHIYEAVSGKTSGRHRCAPARRSGRSRGGTGARRANVIGRIPRPLASGRDRGARR